MNKTLKEKINITYQNHNKGYAKRGLPLLR